MSMRRIVMCAVAGVALTAAVVMGLVSIVRAPGRRPGRRPGRG